MSLSFDRLGVAYGDNAVLHDLSLTVAPGRIVGLVGESGSGKSTAALAAIGLLPPYARRSGAVRIDGVAVDERSPDRLRGGTIGMVFQEPMTALNPVMTVGAQIAETIRLHRPQSRRMANLAAVAALERVGLSTPPERYPHELSGGQRQRVAIAIAIAANPRFLVADEPTTALDVLTQAHILALLRRLVAETGMGLLLVSHDLGMIAETADEVAVLSNGRLVEQGLPREVLSRPADAYTRTLIAKARHVPRRLVAPETGGPPLLDVRGLVCTYPGARHGLQRLPPLRAVDGVEFTIGRGETVGLVGESGSGKTSLLRAVLALAPVAAGEVRLHGEVLSAVRGPALRRLRRDIQAVFQDPYGSFDPRYNVERIIAEPLHLLDEPPTSAERRRRVDAVLAEVGLTAAHADCYPHQFSGGQRQRIAIARALIVEPALIVLDEAVSALDVSIRADILDLLAALSDRLRVSYLFVSHDLSVMRTIADRLLVMQNGRIVEQGPTADIVAAPRHPYTAALLAATPALG